jgi:hypothetical protein
MIARLLLGGIGFAAVLFMVTFLSALIQESREHNVSAARINARRETL